MKIMRIAAIAPVVVSLSLASSVLAQTAQTNALKEIPADKAKVTGSLVVDYNSRSERSQNNVDVYELTNLAIADLMVLNGNIQRVPEKKLTYSVKIDVANPANPSQIVKDAAILRGDLGIDAKGVYSPDAGQLRIDVVKGSQSTNKFSGSIQGRAVARWWNISARLKTAAKEATKVYSRYVDGHIVNIKVKNPDPLRFEQLGLASGPFSFLALVAESHFFLGGQIAIIWHAAIMVVRHKIKNILFKIGTGGTNPVNFSLADHLRQRNTHFPRRHGAGKRHKHFPAACQVVHISL